MNEYLRVRIIIFRCLDLLGGILKDFKQYIILDRKDTIDESAEDISILNFNDSKRQYCIKTNIFPDFEEANAYFSQKDLYYYCYLLNIRNISTERIFYKAYNISSRDASEFSVKATIDLMFCSNETFRIILFLKDLERDNPLKPVTHKINISKHSLINGSKFSSELLRYKEFFFVVQTEFVTLENNEN